MRNDKRHQEIVLPPDELKRELGRRTRRGFLIGAVAALGGFGAYEWLTKAGAEDEVPWPQRGTLNFNEKLAHAYLSDGHLMPTFSADQVTYLKPNGDYGLGSDFDPASWRLSVSLEDDSLLHLRMSDITALPKVEMTTRFCCIEGWNVVTSWGGARFADFTRKFFPPGRSSRPTST